MKYWVRLGYCGPTDCTLQLVQVNSVLHVAVAAREYGIDSLPHRILSLAWKPAFTQKEVQLDSAIGRHVWNTFTDFVEVKP